MLQDRFALTIPSEGLLLLDCFCHFLLAGDDDYQYDGNGELSFEKFDAIARIDKVATFEELRATDVGKAGDDYADKTVTEM